MTTLLFCCHPLTGHFTPVVRIAAGLKQRGWPVAFLSSEFFRARIEAAGLEYLPLLGDAALDDASLFDRDGSLPKKEGFSPEEAAQLPQSVTDSRHQALFALPGEWASLQAAIRTLAGRSSSDNNRILVVSEAFFYGAMPLKYGSAFDCPQLLPRSVCISITAPAIRSVDLPPFGHPAPRATSDAERAALAAIWDEWLVKCTPLTDVLTAKLRESGVPQTSLDAARHKKNMVFMGGANYVCHDAIAQVGVPEFEFPRSDPVPGFRVVGIVPPVVPSAPPPFPWWDTLVANHTDGKKKKKKVVVVAQGTVETEPRELIVPTLEILASHDADVITIAILGVRGATLSAPLPANGFVADYLSYDAVLPFADLWVHNGGYGATTHGIAHGVPMVIAGDTQDKPENGKRVQACGLGVDLQTAHPTKDNLRAAILRVLDEPGYAAVAKSLQATHERMDCVGNVEALIREQIEACK